VGAGVTLAFESVGAGVAGVGSTAGVSIEVGPIGESVGAGAGVGVGVESTGAAGIEVGPIESELGGLELVGTAGVAGVVEATIEVGPIGVLEAVEVEIESVV
jgi:hypothetical protein